MTALGQDRKSSQRANVVRCSPNSGLKSDIASCPFRAMNGSRLVCDSTMSMSRNVNLYDVSRMAQLSQFPLALLVISTVAS
jgi:hypothetical protein